MGTIAQKLTYLEDTKTAIGNAIAAKGGSVTGKTFRQYATEISNLPSGGGNQDLIDLIERDITTLSIPSGTTKIGNYAFYGFGTLTSSVTIPNGVTSIGKYAFGECRGLTRITIPSSVTNIGSGVFNYCVKLLSITCLATTPPELESSSAFSNSNNCYIYVPAESVNTYKAASNWSTHANRIQAIPS